MKKLAGRKTASISFTAENVIKAVARETGSKEADLEAEEIEFGICFEVRAIGKSDLGGEAQVWVLRDRSAAERRAMELVLEKKFGYMASLKGTEVVAVPIQDAVGTLKTVDTKFYDIARIFFG